MAPVRLLMRLRLGLGGCGGLGVDGCGLGVGAVGRSGARWRARWPPLASGLLGFVCTGLGVAFAAVAGWVVGLGGGAAGLGVRRVPLCGAWGSWGAVGAASICALMLAGLRGGVCARGWAWVYVQQAPAFSSRLLEGLCRRLRTYGRSWGAGRLRGWTPLGWSASASMASHAACGIHPPTGWRPLFCNDPLWGR